MQIKYQQVYKALGDVREALDRLQDEAERAKAPCLCVAVQLIRADLHDAAHDDGVIG